MKVAHISDVHFGRIADPVIVDVLVREVNAANVDAVVISGDLTQRARRKEYRAAAAMLEAFSAPVLVVPGNHDVYPYWYPFQRIFSSVERYKRFISSDLTPSLITKGVAILGINSAHGLTIKGGRIRRKERDAIEAFFSKEVPASAFKILAVHHHLSRLAGLWRHDIVRGAKASLDTVGEAGIDLILCGHLHVAHVEEVETVAGQTVVIASAGTATSDRGRKWDSAKNYYNLITVKADTFDINQRCYNPIEKTYCSIGSTVFNRSS